MGVSRMKSTMAGRGSLSPRAASLVPLSKSDDDEAPPQPHQHQHLLESSLPVKKTNSSPPPQQYVPESIEEDVNVDINFLKKMFPYYAEQSLRDVYFANYADVIAAMLMLADLELDFDECFGTLHIDNVSESETAAGNVSESATEAGNVSESATAAGSVSESATAAGSVSESATAAGSDSPKPNNTAAKASAS